jgi:hypothetical protein
MTDMELLQLEALESCAFRGHTMGPWQGHDLYGDKLAYAFCVHCDMQVVVNTYPLPNEIDICGEAVALDCCERSNTND